MPSWVAGAAEVGVVASAELLAKVLRGGAVPTSVEGEDGSILGQKPAKYETVRAGSIRTRAYFAAGGDEGAAPGPPAHAPLLWGGRWWGSIWALKYQFRGFGTTACFG